MGTAEGVKNAKKGFLQIKTSAWGGHAEAIYVMTDRHYANEVININIIY